MRCIVLILACLSSANVFSDVSNLSAENAATVLTDDLWLRVSGDKGHMLLNGKPLVHELENWKTRFRNNFESCDELAIYNNNQELQKTCYLSLAKEYADWIEFSENKSLSPSAWRAAAAGSFYANNVDLSQWVSLSRLYQAREDKKKKEHIKKYVDDSLLLPKEDAAP